MVEVVTPQKQAIMGAASAMQCSNLRHFWSWRGNHSSIKFTTTLPRLRLRLRTSSCPLRLRASPNQDQNSDSLVSQEELGFLLKLGGGSVIGAAIIKYGSVVFPEVTRPNIVLALTIIATPVVVAVLLLIKQSLGDKQT